MDSSALVSPLFRRRAASRSTSLMLALAFGLSACGGGGSGGSPVANDARQTNTQQDDVVLNLPPPAPVPDTPEPIGTTAPMGQWSPIYDWPQVAVHLTLLPDGRLMSWANDNDADDHVGKWDSTKAYVLDLPPDGVPQRPGYFPNMNDNLFCGGHTLLPDGRLFVAGGDLGGGEGIASTNIFDFRTNTWQKVGNMNGGRWYPTTVTLANGDVLVTTGLMTLATGHNLIPQVWNPDRGWRDLTGASRDVTFYSPMHLAPDGRVFMSGSEVMSAYLDTAGAGKWTNVAAHNHEIWRDYAPSVLYGDGKVMVMGGGDPPVTSVETINLMDTDPKWRTISPMRFARRHHNATITADGKVLVTGGTASRGFNDAANAVLAAESWNPKTEQWTTMASMKVARVYHSTALLLPDGRVLSTGGGRPAPVNGVENFNAEIYSPPYLFNGPRPTITSAPASIVYNQRFTVGTPEPTDIVKATFIRLGSTTHTLNTNQRINHLSVQQIPGSAGVSIVAPESRNLTPPGHYMLFLINSKGVPSIAKVVQIL